MNDDIIIALDLVDDESSVTDFHVVKNIKFITLEKNLTSKFCPVCHCRLHSKGKFTRHPNNPVLQDGYKLDVTLIGRRWFCSNPDCDYTENDEFPFIEPRKRNTKIVPLLIVYALKDIHLTCREVAIMFNTSDTYVHNTFMHLICPKRKPLPSIISIDEVYLNTSPTCKYALVILDWKTKEVIDLLPSRRKNYTEKYFLNIPKKERDNVKFLICDMYNSYINYTINYFTNAEAIVDSFHVVQWILNLINQYINDVKKRYQKRDRKILEEKNNKERTCVEKPKQSREVYILNHARWVLLKSEKNIEYHEKRYNYFLQQYLDTYDWEKIFLELDDNFSKIRSYKELYENFNSSYINDMTGASEKLDEIIGIYETCGISIFNRFAILLKKYKKQIINSFTYINVQETIASKEKLRRLSNGPIESFNNIPSSYRTQSHGIENFEYTRARILWANREDESILGIPKSNSEIQVKTGKTRGPYKKK